MVEQKPPKKRTRSAVYSALAIFAAALGFLLYWMTAHQIQGVNLQGWLPPTIEQLINTYPLFDPMLPIIDFVVEMFSLSVLIHLVVVGFGYYLARRLILEVVQQLYDLPNEEQTQRLLHRLQVTPSPLLTRPLALDRRRFLEQRRAEPILSIGGPGFVNISESDVVVTEINGRFERVLGFGRQTLRRFERVVAILDLRDQEMTRKDVDLMTKEGLPLDTDIHIQFRIKRRNTQREGQLGYTFDEESVRKAAYNQTVTEFGINRWTSQPINIAVGQLAAIVAQKRLDELIDPNKIYDLAPQPEIQQMLTVRMRQILSGLGLELIDVRYTTLRLSAEMQTVMLDYWKSFGKKVSSPQDEEAKKAQATRRAREAMIQSLASGIATVRERKLAEVSRPQSGEQTLTQMLQLMQGVMIQQNQLPSLAAPQQPKEVYRLNLRRDKINHLVWQLLQELEGALRSVAPLTEDQLYTALESPRLKLRMRDAVTSFATLSVGAASGTPSYALQTTDQVQPSYDVLVIEQAGLPTLAKELVREATRALADDLALSEMEVSQWLTRTALAQRYVDASAQHFLPPVTATVEQMSDLTQRVLGEANQREATRLLTLARGKVNHLVEQLVREMEATAADSFMLVNLDLVNLGRSTRLRLRMRETVTFQANPATSGAAVQPQSSIIDALDTLTIQQNELEILARQLVWETAITAEEEMDLTRDQREMIVQSAELFSRYRNIIARYFTPLPNETPQQMHQLLQLTLKQKQLRTAGRLLFLERSEVNNLVWQLIHDFESILRSNAILTNGHSPESIRTAGLQLFMREAVTFQAKPAVASALRTARYSLHDSQRMETVHRLPKYDTLVVQQSEVETMAQQLISGAAVTAAGTLELSAEQVEQLQRSAELSDRFRNTITQFFLPPPNPNNPQIGSGSTASS